MDKEGGYNHIDDENEKIFPLVNKDLFEESRLAKERQEKFPTPTEDVINRLSQIYLNRCR